MTNKFPDNAVMLVDNGIMGWGLTVQGNLPILVDEKDMEVGGILDCPYAYQFLRGCPFLGTEKHDAPAMLRHVRFHDAVSMEPVIEEEGDEHRIYIGVTQGDAQPFWLLATVTPEHRHLNLTLTEAPKRA